jgi:hypothetical protein
MKDTYKQTNIVNSTKRVVERGMKREHLSAAY